MKVALISKNKLQFVDGTFTQPATENVLHNQWLRCNNMVLSWLQRSISEGIAQSIIWIDKHGYPPDFSSKNHKSNINNTTASDSPTGSNVAQDDTSPSLAVIQDQYSQILQLLQSNHGVSSHAPMTQAATNTVADHYHHDINSVSFTINGTQQGE